MKILRKLIEQFELANRHHRLLKKKEVLVAGVSGGPDSMALLALLLILKNKYGWKISVAHLDHGLQKNSRWALDGVRRFCQKSGVPFYSRKVNVHASAKRHKTSLEDAGRQERYLFFGAVAKKVKAKKVVTAHTLDDQAETVLMRILRGAGSRGLAGIPYKRSLGPIELVRPLLSSSKKDLLCFVRESGVPFVKDPSNRDTVFLRNRIRQRLLPLLRRQYSPRIDEQLASLQILSTQTQEYVRTQALSAYKKCLIKESSGRIEFRAKAILKLPEALQGELLFMALSRLKGDGAGFGHAHIQSILSTAASAHSSPETHLPHGLRARKTGPKLIINSSFIDRAVKYGYNFEIFKHRKEGVS